MGRIIVSMLSLSASLALLPGCSPAPDPDGGAHECPPPREDERGEVSDTALPSLSHILEPESLQISEDGTRLAAMHGDQILIWDEVEGGEPSRTVGDASDPLGSGPMAATPDLSRFAVRGDGAPETAGSGAHGDASRDAHGTVDVISLDGGSEVVETLALEPWHDDEQVSRLAISPDGERLAVRGTSGLIAIHSSTDLGLEMTLPACAESPGDIAFSPDSSKLFAAGRADGAEVWDLDTQETALELASGQHGYSHGAWSEDEDLLAVSASSLGSGAGSSWNVTLVDTAEWEVIRTYPELSPTSTSFLPGGEELLVATGANWVQRWPIGGTPQELSTGVTTRGAHVSPDGGTAYVANRETLIGFDLEAAEVRVTYDIPTFDCESVEHPGMFQECQ